MKVFDYINKKHKQQKLIYYQELIAATLVSSILILAFILMLFYTENGTDVFYSEVLRIFEKNIYGISRVVWLLFLIFCIKYFKLFSVWFFQSIIMWVLCVKNNTSGKLQYSSNSLAFLIISTCIVIGIYFFTLYLIDSGQYMYITSYSEYEFVNIIGELLTNTLALFVLGYLTWLLYNWVLHILLLMLTVIRPDFSYSPTSLPKKYFQLKK